MFKRMRTKIQKSVNALAATVLVASQFFIPILATQPAFASPTKITAKTHQGQKSDLSYTSGNITQYTEGDFINFRFTLEATHGPTSGQIEVRYTGDDGTCTFFDGSFSLGAVTSTGPAPTVTTVGTPVATDFGTSNGEWVQALNVNYPTTFDHTANETIVNYTIRLSDEAGECNGSSQHSRLNPSGGTVEQTGVQNVPVPANQVIELPEIFVEKWVDTNADGVVDRRATAGEWSFSLDDGTPVATDANGTVTFTNVTPNGNHTVTESNGPAGQSFLNGSGTNCTFVGSTATANVQSGTTAQDATCIFNNGIAPGQITIVKNAVPNNLTDFAFTASGAGVSNFTLDDDSGVAGADSTNNNTKIFTGLATGQYTFTEAAVSGWDLTDISCPNATVVKDLVNRSVTITLSAGQQVSCTFENRQRGQIIVTKQTNPDGDTTQFSVTASGTGTIHSGATQNVTDNNSVTFTVGHGTYDINETVPTGWSVDESDCQDLVINGNTPLVNGVPTETCTITNTKLAKLKIIKDALPNHEQNFEFSVTNLPGGNFFLDDDSDNVLSNEKLFSNLTPGQSYSVTELSTSGWSLTELSCNGVVQNGSTATVTPTAGQEITCTFKNTKLISVSGTKYTANADSSLGPVLSGWTIYIDSNNNGVKDDGELSDVTDSNGDYSFENLLYGTTVILREVLLSGWTQIFGPNSFTLNTANDVTDQDFGNFENATISGFKWNDKNANDVVNDGEEKLNGWTITLYNDGADEDTDLDDQVAQTTTAGEGTYSFTNLAPGTYSVCETQQTGWVQTFPNDNACHTKVINVSGETEEANFGNQGRGTITVNKNVDTDGDGDIDTTSATDWTWDLGSTNFATGSTENVAAGDYNIHEDQQTNYHFTSVSCTRNGQTFTVTQAETVPVTVNPGNAIICTFVNTRDTGTITVNKVVDPSTGDNGLFNLQINGATAGTGVNVGHGGSTGAVSVVTGTYNVGETAGTDTDLADYSTTYSCVNGQQAVKAQGAGTLTTDFGVASGESVVCTITNVRYGHIIVEKQTLPDGSSQLFDFDADYDQDGFSLSDDQTNNSGNLLPDTYSVSEDVSLGWDLVSVSCTDGSDPDEIELSAGETVTCTFYNTERGSISGTKYEVDAEETDGTNGTPLFGWTIFIDEDDEKDLDLGEANTSTDLFGNYSFDDLVPGTYVICEVLQSGWTQIFPEGKPGCHTVTLDPGEEDENNDFGNFENGSISGYKFEDVNGDGTHDIDEPQLENWEIVLREGLDIVDTVFTDSNGDYEFTNLDPGTYEVCEELQTDWVQTTVPVCHTVVIDESGETNTDMNFGNQGQGTITVNKEVLPTEGDDGLFNLQINDVTEAEDIGDEGSTGAIILPVGTHSVSETAGTNTNLSDYDTSYECTDGETTVASGDGTEVTGLTLNLGHDIVCTFTNVRHGSITVIKDAVPNNEQDFHFTITKENFELFDFLGITLYDILDSSINEFDLDDDSTTTPLSNTEVTEVSAGFYTITEDQVSGWDLTDIDCGDIQVVDQDENSITIFVGIGEDITCTFTNQKRAMVVVTKFNDLNQNGVQDNGEEALSDWEITLNTSKQSTGQNGSTTFSNLLPNEKYTVGETQQTGWTFTRISCSGDMGHAAVTSRETASLDVFPAAGETVTCKIGNFKPTPAVLAAQTLEDTGQGNLGLSMAVGLGLLVFALTVLRLPTRSKANNSAVISLSRIDRLL